MHPKLHHLLHTAKVKFHQINKNKKLKVIIFSTFFLLGAISIFAVVKVIETQSTAPEQSQAAVIDRNCCDDTSWSRYPNGGCSNPSQWDEGYYACRGLQTDNRTRIDYNDVCNICKGNVAPPSNTYVNPTTDNKTNIKSYEIRCSSVANKEQFCGFSETGQHTVSLIRKESTATCDGAWSSNTVGITVKNGCRATFLVSSNSSNTQQVTYSPVEPIGQLINIAKNKPIIESSGAVDPSDVRLIVDDNMNTAWNVWTNMQGGKATYAVIDLGGNFTIKQIKYLISWDTNTFTSRGNIFFYGRRDTSSSWEEISRKSASSSVTDYITMPTNSYRYIKVQWYSQGKLGGYIHEVQVLVDQKNSQGNNTTTPAADNCCADPTWSGKDSVGNCNWTKGYWACRGCDINGKTRIDAKSVCSICGSSNNFMKFENSCYK